MEHHAGRFFTVLEGPVFGVRPARSSAPERHLQFPFKGHGNLRDVQYRPLQRRPEDVVSGILNIGLAKQQANGGEWTTDQCQSKEVTEVALRADISPLPRTARHSCAMPDT